MVFSAKIGKADINFSNDNIGPGIPVPKPAVEFEPCMSLARCKDQSVTAIAHFLLKSLPIISSGTS